jgi:hypothetical protein
MVKDQSKIKEMLWTEKVEIIQWLALFPAITVMVFIRRKIGFRMLKPGSLFIMAIILLVFSYLFGGGFLFGGLLFGASLGPFPMLIKLYALAMLGMGFYQRFLRWRELCNGVRWHTYCPGISILEVLSIPAFLQANRRIYRFLDPLLCWLVAQFIVARFSTGLAAWLAFASFALYMYENALFEKMLEQDLDTLDGLIASEVQMETVKHFEGPQPEEKQRKLQDTGGIPTGAAPDIHRQIELRKIKMAKAPDNLAKET